MNMFDKGIKLTGAEHMHYFTKKLIKSFLKFYRENGADPQYQNLTNALAKEILKNLGYNNYSNSAVSGEQFFIEKILAPTSPRLCIDIGANIGKYSIDLLEKTKSKVISFEPLPRTFQELSRNCEKYGSRSVLENFGVGSENKIQQLHFDPEALTHASLSEEVNNVSYVNNKLTENVSVITLDHYCHQNQVTEIDFVKIDTEGYEAEVFSGASKTFSEIRPKFIQIEFNWHQLFRGTTLFYFSSLLADYDLYQLMPGRWVQRDPKDPLANIYQYSNFVFVAR
ncbi:FkbM family methyltransferase [Roseibium sp.]|uniref:FkbM family methyltransferase n=1 Tax=Roseibium sp. TaxID=1936156 RepID=UPI003D0BE1E8